MKATAPFRVLLATLGSLSFVNVVPWVGGCSFLETQLQRQAPADNRITLGWQDRVSLRSRDIANYRCEENYFLVCDRGGSITLSCTCAPR
jgi:hypothetical protein